MQFIRKTILPIVIAAFLPHTAVGQESASGYSWLNISSSSRVYGLGGVNISLVDDDIQTIDQNPALLGTEMSGQIGVNYMHYIGGSNFAGVRYGHSAGERGAWALNLQYFGYGSIRETLPDGTVVGNFSPKDVAFGGVYSRDITENLRGGINFKMLYSGYADYTAFALAADVGVNYFNPDRDQSFSVVLANMGGQIKRFDEAYDRLPFDIRLGWSQSFGSFPVRFSITAWNLTKWRLPFVETGDGSQTGEPQIKDTFVSNLFRHLVFGADLISSPNFYIGLGYNYKTRTDMATYKRSFISGWSLAGGFKGRAFAIGLALAQPHTSATTFMVNLNLSLNDLLNK
ncbi:MAG: type IX secretion system protein PorQ [Muribaculaceae bacterium]|nr:type IX secretion system protein PorQ [Muribaculaceae bacterium]